MAALPDQHPVAVIMLDCPGNAPLEQAVGNLRACVALRRVPGGGEDRITGAQIVGSLVAHPRRTVTLGDHARVGEDFEEGCHSVWSPAVVSLGPGRDVGCWFW